MSDASEPGQGEVLAYMARTGASPSEAAAFYFRDAAPELLRSRAQLYSKWKRKAQKRGDLPAPTSAPVAPPPPSIPSDGLPLTPEQERVEFLAEELRLMVADLQRARSPGGDRKLIPALDSRVQALRAELDAARKATGQTVRLDRLPARVAAETLKRYKALAILAEAQQRLEQRDPNDFVVVQ